MSIFNGATSSELSSHENWKGAYNIDPATKAILDILDNFSKVDSLDVTNKVNYVYRVPLRKHMISWKNSRLAMKEPIVNLTMY